MHVYFTMVNSCKCDIFKRRKPGWAIEHFDFILIIVTTNTKLIGTISDRSRQIDVLFKIRVGCNTKAHVIVEAKLYCRPLDIEVIVEIKVNLQDVNAINAGIATFVV